MADYKVVDAEQLDADLTIVADAIREKGGTTEQLSFPQGMKQAVEAIQSGNGGSSADYWKYVKNIQALFKNAVFEQGTELNIKFESINFNYGGIGEIFSFSKGLKSVKLSSPKIDKTVSYMSAFYSASDIEIIDLSDFNTKVNALTQAFYAVGKLKSILGELDCTDVNGSQWGAFLQLEYLEDISFKAGTIAFPLAITQSSKLSNASIESIINGLATVETAQTLTLHADVKAKLTDTQLTTITSKNWTLA